MGQSRSRPVQEFIKHQPWEALPWTQLPGWPSEPWRGRFRPSVHLHQAQPRPLASPGWLGCLRNKLGVQVPRGHTYLPLHEPSPWHWLPIMFCQYLLNGRLDVHNADCHMWPSCAHVALPQRLSLQLEMRLGLQVGPRLRRRESEAGKPLSLSTRLFLIDYPSDEPFCRILLGPSFLAEF